MKRILTNSLLVLGASLMFTSCLKDKGFEEGKYGIKDIENGPKVIEIPQAAIKPYVHALNTDPALETLDAFEINFASGVTAPEDIQVTLVKNMTIVSDYNAANSTNYIELPANTYTLPSNLTATIKKGTNRVNFKINLIKTNFDFSKAYAIGYSLASVSPAGYTISQNFKNIMLSIGLKNKYDGKYLLSGYHTRPPAALPNYSSPYANVPVQLHTAGASSVSFYWDAAGANGHPFSTSPGVLAWYGTAVGPIFTMNPTTNVVTSAVNASTAVVIDLATNLNPNPRFTWNTTTNKPEKLFVAFRYSANDARAFVDTFTYVGPR